MNFFTTLSEKLGFKPKENDEEREEDELELVIGNLTYAVKNLAEVATAGGHVNAGAV